MVKFSLEHISVWRTSNKIVFIKQHKSYSSEMIALHQWRQEQCWKVQFRFESYIFKRGQGSVQWRHLEIILNTFLNPISEKFVSKQINL